MHAEAAGSVYDGGRKILVGRLKLISMAHQPSSRLRFLRIAFYVGGLLFAVGWCLLVMYGVKPSVAQPELGMTYRTWSAGPRYVTKRVFHPGWIDVGRIRTRRSQRSDSCSLGTKEQIRLRTDPTGNCRVPGGQMTTARTTLWILLGFAGTLLVVVVGLLFYFRPTIEWVSN